MGNKFSNRTLNNIKVVSKTVPKSYRDALGYEITPEMLRHAERLLKKRFDADKLDLTEIDGVPIFCVLENHNRKTGEKSFGFHFVAPDGFFYTSSAVNSSSLKRELGLAFDAEFDLTPELAIKDFLQYWTGPDKRKYLLEEQPNYIRSEMKTRAEEAENIHKRSGSWTIAPQFSNLADAQNWLRLQPGMEGFAFGKSERAAEPSPENINRIISTLADSQKRLPGIMGRLMEIQIIDPTDYRDEEGNEIRNETTMGHCFGWGDSKILFNLDAILTCEEKWKSGEMNFKKRFSFTNSLENIVYHELAHSLDNQNKVSYLGDSFVGDGQLKSIWENFTMRRDVHDNRPLRSIFSNAGKLDVKAEKTAKKISFYAGTNPQELFAETFAWVFNPANRDFKQPKVDDNVFCRNMEELIDGYRKAVAELHKYYPQTD